MTGVLYEGDALEVMKTLEAGSVGAVVTDPPYGQTNESYESDVAFRPELWRACHRVCTENAPLICFTGSPTYHKIATAIEAGGWKVRQMWAWVYRDGMILSAYPKEGFDRLAPAMTPIVYATKGKVLLPLRREGPAWEVRFSQSTTCEEYSERTNDRRSRPAQGSGRWPRSVVATDGIEGFQYFILSHNATNRRGSTPHPNEKPLPLMEWLVAKLPEGSNVLDPFAGSGTTAEACLRTNRSCVMIERHPPYCEIIRARMKRAEEELAAKPASLWED